jgi:hypothetical protein
MTQPRRDKDGNIIAGPIRKPRTIRKLKPGIAGIGLLPVKRRKKEIGERKAVKKPSPKATAKKVNKVQKQADGLRAIANRKMARANAARKEYDIAKSNPRLAKKLKAKGRAVMNSALSKPAAKKVNKLEKQFDGFEAIARRKSARTGRGITAKSNPRLFKKLVNKERAANRIRNRNK